MTQGTDTANQMAVSIVIAELAYDELESGGFSVRLSGASGAFAMAVPVTIGGLAVFTAVTASVWIGVAMGVLALVLLPRQGGRLHGLKVEHGALHVLGPDLRLPLQDIERVDLTLAGITLHRGGTEPLALQIAQSPGARAWLAERIRNAVVRHGNVEDVPAALARLRGEEAVFA